MAVNEPDRVVAIHRNPTGKAEWYAWHQLVYPALYYVAFRLARGHVETARDLVQEAFARFLRYDGIHRVTSDAASIAYLREICRNVAASRLGVVREVPLEDLDPSDANGSTDEIGDLQLLIRELIRDLRPEDQRLMQWSVEGVPLAEIARKLNVSYSAAGVRIHRLKNFIRGRSGL